MGERGKEDMGHRAKKYALLLIVCLALAGCGTWRSRDSAAQEPDLRSLGGDTETVSVGEPAPSTIRELGSASDQGLGPASDQQLGQASDQQFGQASDQASDQEPGPASDQEPSDTGYDFTICFAGDINLDENWDTTLFMDQQPDGIYGCISPELVETMREAGRARVEVLEQLGVDAVTLANNHVYDYGAEALLDTFAVLEEAEVPYFGAGRTLEEAMEPLYLEVEGKTIALVAASRAEKYKMTPQATDTEPGILRCYDTELFLQAIREGSENADFCIAFVHWGTEYSFDLEQVQLDTGREYLDAGADAVIGAHSHCLQGMEYYDGKPIIYSLGNYWFNSKTLDTMLLQLHFSGDDTGTELEVQVVPAVQAGCRTTYAAQPEERRRIYDFLESISVNVEISDEGFVTEKSQ